MKNVVLLGSTGSIGTSTVKVAGDLPDEIRLVGLSAGSKMELLANQALQFRPELVSIGSPEMAVELRDTFNQIHNRGVPFPGRQAMTGTRTFIGPAVQAILLRRAAGMLENYQRGCQQGGGEGTRVRGEQQPASFRPWLKPGSPCIDGRSKRLRVTPGVRQRAIALHGLSPRALRQAEIIAPSADCVGRKGGHGGGLRSRRRQSHSPANIRAIRT